MRKKISILIASATLILIMVYFMDAGVIQNEKADLIKTQSDQQQKNIEQQQQEPSLKNTANENQPENAKQQKLVNVQLDVPFVLQAPFANWKDPIFQNACEESSIVMTMGWLNGVKQISAEQAQKQILDIVKFEDKTFGYNADTDVSDIQKIFQQKFGVKKVVVRENIALVDIIDELEKGNLVLAPAFGQALKNSNYTPPGPIAHMLVITGYDPNAHTFITNDSGTRKGAGFIYKENVLYNAIWQYPSGPGPLEPPTKLSWNKTMIVIAK